MPIMAGGTKRNASGNSRVFVRGFDFGTTDEQLEAHMSSVGTIANVQWITKGSAEVTYSSADEAAAAVAQLQKSTIDGNSRFIDVLAKGDEDQHPKRFKGGGGSYGGGGGGKGGDLMAMLGKLLGGGGKSWGKGGGGGQSGGKGGGAKSNSDDDPPGSGRVFARGFDFGTDDAVFEAHMSTVGPIHQVHWVTKGSAVVVYKKKASAVKAASKLNQTTIEGNSRYIDVILKEPE